MKYGLLGLLLMTGCTWQDVCKIPGLCSVTPTPTPTPVYVVTKGKRVEQSCNVPCSLEFDITNHTKEIADDLIEAHLAWAVTEGGDWNGGNPSPGTYSAAFKDYKLKVYSVDKFAGETRLRVQFVPTLTYHVKAEVTSDWTAWTISRNGVNVGAGVVDAKAPAKVTFGYGWPPSKRNGCEGAKITNVVLK